eukprot:4938448-Prymnesium_polylepis.1
MFMWANEPEVARWSHVPREHFARSVSLGLSVDLNFALFLRGDLTDSVLDRAARSGPVRGLD